MSRTPRLLLLMTVLAGLSACSSFHFPGVYRIDIAQGNFVTQDMLAQLKPGMTSDQVRYVLGNPTLQDPFTPDAWYYLMTFRPGKGKPVSQHIVVYFDNSGHYTRYTGQVIADFREKTSGRKDLELQNQAESRRREAADGDLSSPEPSSEGGGAAPVEQAQPGMTPADTGDGDGS